MSEESGLEPLDEVAGALKKEVMLLGFLLILLSRKVNLRGHTNFALASLLPQWPDLQLSVSVTSS